MKTMPIRLRLSLWYCVMFATAAALLSVSSYLMLRRSLAATEYHELQERAEDVQLLLRQLGPNAGLDSLRQKFVEIYQVKDDGKYLQVFDQNGVWIFRSKRLVDAGLQPASPESLPSQGTLIDFHQGTRFVRVLSYRIVANGRSYFVQTGLALNKSNALLSMYRVQLLLLTPAVIFLAAIGGHLMSRTALAPVAAIATEARRINDKNLGIRLPVADTRDEISHLSETLNQMLERVDTGVQSIRDFTANAAHELRTPIALIRTEVEVALSLPRSSREYREACEQVQLETVRMTALIDNLLMLARVDAETEGFRLLPVEATQLARRVGERWKHAMQRALLDFTFEMTPPPVLVMADDESLQRLLTILLDNALHYTPPGGAVTLSVVRTEDGQVHFRVRDTGIGIAPEHQPRVFERFYRVDHSRGGSGLGLALAKWIAEKHGTEISINSTLGRGAAFHFALPEAAPAQTSQNRNPSKTAGVPT
jgi:heavy metal sensor kinase